MAKQTKKSQNKPKNKKGRPSKCKGITSAAVRRLAGYGCTQTEIADFYGVDKSTISRKFSTEHTKGIEGCKQRLRKKQINMALKGNVSLLIWLGKQMLGQKDKTEQEIGGRGGGPIEVTVVHFDNKK